MSDAERIKQFNFIEKKLIFYDEIDTYIEGLELEMKILFENNTYGITSLNYESIKTSQTNKISYHLEEAVIKFIKKIEDLGSKITREKDIKSKIDLVINKSKPIEKDIMKRGYIEGIGWKVIAYENNIDMTTLRRYRNKVIERIVRMIFDDVELN